MYPQYTLHTHPMTMKNITIYKIPTIKVVGLKIEVYLYICLSFALSMSFGNVTVCTFMNELNTVPNPGIKIFIAKISKWNGRGTR